MFSQSLELTESVPNSVKWSLEHPTQYQIYNTLLWLKNREMIYVWQPQKYRNAHPSPQLISHLYLMHWQFQLDGPLWDIVIAAVTQTEGAGLTTINLTAKRPSYNNNELTLWSLWDLLMLVYFQYSILYCIIVSISINFNKWSISLIYKLLNPHKFRSYIPN